MNRWESLKKCFIFFCLVIGALLILPSTGRAGETVTLKNGKVLNGNIAAWNGNRTMIYFQSNDLTQEPQWISLSEIDRLQFGAVIFDQNPTVKPADVKKEGAQDPSRMNAGKASGDNRL